MGRLIESDLQVSPELAKQLEEARGREMTAAERYEQRISFAYGNLALHDPTVTKDHVREVAEELYGKPPGDSPR